MYILIRMSDPWIQHVRVFAKQHGLSYMYAVTDPQCRNRLRKGRTLKQLQRQRKQK